MEAERFSRGALADGRVVKRPRGRCVIGHRSARFHHLARVDGWLKGKQPLCVLWALWPELVDFSMSRYVVRRGLERTNNISPPSFGVVQK